MMSHFEVSLIGLFYLYTLLHGTFSVHFCYLHIYTDSILIVMGHQCANVCAFS